MNDMIITYNKTQSTLMPDMVDTTSSKTIVYLRKNIEKKQITNNMTDEPNWYYEYDEAKLTRKEYQEYLSELSIKDIQQQRADIDYIALMTDVDLGGNMS